MELGYQFAPPEYDHAPGSHRLDVNLYETPTLQHYDPEQMTLNVVTHDGVPETLTVVHPWPQSEDTQRACVGHVSLNDRTGKKVSAYTLGGKLHIHRGEDKTHCVLESDAPILQLGEITQIPSMLADEIEILIAERATDWLPDIEGHQKRLAQVNPQRLYAACLKRLSEKYDSFDSQALEHIFEFRNFLTQEIATLQETNRWPQPEPELEELI